MEAKDEYGNIIHKEDYVLVCNNNRSMEKAPLQKWSTVWRLEAVWEWFSRDSTEKIFSKMNLIFLLLELAHDNMTSIIYT